MCKRVAFAEVSVGSQECFQITFVTPQNKAISKSLTRSTILIGMQNLGAKQRNKIDKTCKASVKFFEFRKVFRLEQTCPFIYDSKRVLS